MNYFINKLFWLMFLFLRTNENTLAAEEFSKSISA